MRITVTVKPNAKEEKIVQLDEKSFAIWVKEPPREGRANNEVLRQMAQYFRVPEARVRIPMGHGKEENCRDYISLLE